MQMGQVPPVRNVCGNSPRQVVLVEIQFFESLDLVDGVGDGSMNIVPSNVEFFQVVQELYLGRYRSGQTRVREIDFLDLACRGSNRGTDDTLPGALVDFIYGDGVGPLVGFVFKGGIGEGCLGNLLAILFEWERIGCDIGPVERVIQRQEGKALDDLFVQFKSVSVGAADAIHATELCLVGEPLDGHEVGRQWISFEIHLVVLEEFHERIDVVLGWTRGGMLCVRERRAIRWSAAICGSRCFSVFRGALSGTLSGGRLGRQRGDLEFGVDVNDIFIDGIFIVDIAYVIVNVTDGVVRT
mmetsp:Transcript_19533/g.45503  ORF Transcript_19533/g.45503 Transcript_19533/m.45503 type:complete len:298 (-) Transcript_19533:1158-2051(-)